MRDDSPRASGPRAVVYRGTEHGLADRLPEGPLTVAAVAARLGVAASTLRTWDRRYGLGPSGREAGRHRRYSPDDLARLETMRALTERGVALADAARIALHSAPARDERESEAASAILDPLSLAAAGVDSHSERLERLLATAVERDGLMATFTNLVQPARQLLQDTPRPDVPGRAPCVALVAAMMSVVRARTEAARAPWLPLALVISQAHDVLAAHVLAGALWEEGVPSRVCRPDVREEVVRAQRGEAAIVIELYDGADRAEGAESRDPGAAQAHPREAHDPTTSDLLLVGHGVPQVPGAHRVRTLAAALPEALDLLRARDGGDEAGSEEPPRSAG